MGIMRSVGKGLGKIFNFQIERWLDYRSLKNTTLYLYNRAKSLYSTPKNPSRTETYHDAVARLELSPEDLQQQMNHFQLLARVFFGLFILILIYGLWISLLGNWMGGIMCLALSIYALTNAFRYDFWKYQIQRQKLGCTVQEWFHHRINMFSSKGK
jgi:intracellular multiplication protein IcmV